MMLDLIFFIRNYFLDLILGQSFVKLDKL